MIACKYIRSVFAKMALICDSGLINYLHEFWIQTFVTAKYWGRGPLLWTKEMITDMTLDSSVISSSAHAAPEVVFSFSPKSSDNETTTILMPKQKCGWLVHAEDEALSDDLLKIPWPLAKLDGRSFPQLMLESITESTFTSRSPEDLPVSNSLIAESLRKDPSSLYLESLRFAIMAGNYDLVESLIEEGMKEPRFIESLMEIYPYHLAAGYLCGSNPCCLMFDILNKYIGDHYPIAQTYDDAAGHTVLDSLIISIIRSHTRVSPRDVSPYFIDRDLYPGEEKDVCGRWDADSPAVRQLFQRGKYRIPLNWKHPFCHTSVQAVYHCSLEIFFPGSYVPHINRLSGLFIRHCATCGAKLSLGTLHLIVVLAYHLADSGILGETLFGAVAMSVCLLRLGANASFKAEVSFDEILGVAFLNECHHANLDACDFMQTVPSATLDRWSPECQIGWHCMHGVLRLAKYGKIRRLNTEAGGHPGPGDQFDIMDVDNDANDDSGDSDDNDGSGESGESGDGGDSDSSDGSDDDGESENNNDISTTSTSSCWLEEFHCSSSSLPCGNPQLGLIWAAVQAEVLTYRKTKDLDPWISDYFSMVGLKRWLQGESVELEMPFAQKDMLREHTICGWFVDAEFFHIPTPYEVTKQHIMNYCEPESELESEPESVQSNIV
ncbi:hypothetical protein H0G86_001637 [Trichoderma simmonsii]|uniref:Uncharacterized protein n=1 Tax=Trichoderma simmonsii TaxID=1491479 RepID=A0A8G0L1Y9_9HYPO|nr:hypothetical protein H0G86_001637 [Trichoderma simmonsii]